MDITNLAGVIGTWVAVSLALVALAGIVTPVLIMRQTRSESHKAINAIDTQDSGCVVKRLKLAGRNHLFLSVKVPLLDEPPDAKKHFPCINKPSQMLRKRKISSTGWVNLINIVGAYATVLELGNNLVIRNGNAWFPMHHLWLLIVGLRGRYADRKDGGEEFQSRLGNPLPIEIARRDSKWQNTQSTWRLSGTTGTLWWKRRLDSSELPIDEVYFAQLQSRDKQEPSSNGDFGSDPISISDLLWLGLGCLPSHTGDKIFDLGTCLKPYDSRPRATNGRIPLFLKYENRNSNESGPHVQWAKATGIKMERLHSQKKVDLDSANWAEHAENAEHEIGDWFAFEDCGSEGYLWRSDVHGLAYGITHLGVSSKGVLLDHSRISDGIQSIFKTFRPKVRELLECFLQHSSSDNLASNDRDQLKKLEHFLQFDPIHKFSSRESELGYQVDRVLQQQTRAIGGPQRLVLEIVGILTLTSQIFFDALKRSREIFVEVDWTTNTVNTPAQEDGTEHKHCMQFSELFSKYIQENSPSGRLRYDEKSMMLCTAIRAGLRGLMLEQSLDSRGLIDLVLRSEKTVQVAVRDSAPIVIHNNVQAESSDLIPDSQGTSLDSLEPMVPGSPEDIIRSRNQEDEFEQNHPQPPRPDGSDQSPGSQGTSLDSPEPMMPGSPEDIIRSRNQEDEFEQNHPRPPRPDARIRKHQKKVKPELTDDEYSGPENGGG